MFPVETGNSKSSKWSQYMIPLGNDVFILGSGTVVQKSWLELMVVHCYMKNRASTASKRTCAWNLQWNHQSDCVQSVQTCKMKSQDVRCESWSSGSVRVSIWSQGQNQLLLTENTCFKQRRHYRNETSLVLNSALGAGQRHVVMMAWGKTLNYQDRDFECRCLMSCVDPERIEPIDFLEPIWAKVFLVVFAGFWNFCLQAGHGRRDWFKGQEARSDIWSVHLTAVVHYPAWVCNLSRQVETNMPGCCLISFCLLEGKSQEHQVGLTGRWWCRQTALDLQPGEVPGAWWAWPWAGAA